MTKAEIEEEVKQICKDPLMMEATHKLWLLSERVGTERVFEELKKAAPAILKYFADGLAEWIQDFEEAPVDEKHLHGSCTAGYRLFATPRVWAERYLQFLRSALAT